VYYETNRHCSFDRGIYGYKHGRVSYLCNICFSKKQYMGIYFYDIFYIDVCGFNDINDLWPGRSYAAYGADEGKEKEKINSKMDVEKEVKTIIERNKKVEVDKAWETSLTRKIILSLITYIIIVVFLIIAEIPKPWLGALVPTLALVLSTLTMPLVKKWWIKAANK
jgi:hypothetical protein|tara:strand:- start:41 stop:538 length:498 start_codon:yes stop_codon:yes gene_type:complete